MKLKYYIDKKDSRFQKVKLDMKEKNGIYHLDIIVAPGEPVDMGNLKINLQYPVKGIYAKWSPNARYVKGISSGWYKPEYYSVASWLPIQSYYGKGGENKFTIAFSDVINHTEFQCGIGEESAQVDLAITLFPNEKRLVSFYKETIYISTEEKMYYEVIQEMCDLYEERYNPTITPKAAFEPMYSTWYSFHQHLSIEDVEKECKTAKEMGCTAVIVDDGWQTADNNRGYAYCGDWEVCKEKIRSMDEFVKCIHNLGMKFLLWYSVPFIGIHSKAYQKFKGMYLDGEDCEWNIPDPRFPEVREHIIGIYKEALIHWDLDGFKLDFIDTFNRAEFLLKDYSYDKRRDFEYIPDAVNKLMIDVLEELRKIKPEIMIEFRQKYIGPAMRQFGNIFRSSDCPADSLTNKINTVDLRLTCGESAVHADMIMFDPDETAEFAALQLIDTLFAVPQISVKLTESSEAQYRMMKFYLDFWKENYKTLLFGQFMPRFVESNYPVISAVGNKQITVLYLPMIAEINSEGKETIVINATAQTKVCVVGSGRYNYSIKNCFGEIVEEGVAELEKQCLYNVPMSGMVIFEKKGD